MFLSQSDPKKWVLPVTCNEFKKFGTGFVIHKDDSKTYVLTCQHVLDDIGDPKSIHVNYKPAYVIASDVSQNGFDLAVLCVDEELDHPVLPLNSTISTGNSFQIAGHYQYGKQRLTESLEGIVGTEVLLESTKHQQRISAWHLILDDEDKLQRGYSGAPVFDSSNQVVGVVGYEQKKGKIGLAISVKALIHIWPAIPKVLLEAIGTKKSSIPDIASSSRPLMNFETELKAFKEIVNGQDADTQLITVHGDSGTGKTRLLQEYEWIAKENGLATVRLSQQTQVTIEDCLDELFYYFGSENFSSYRAFLLTKSATNASDVESDTWYKNLTWEFFGDLAKIGQPNRLVLIIDIYEKADQQFQRWLEDCFLRSLNQKPIIVIMAGQEKISRTPNWHGQRHFELGGVSVDWYCHYAETCGVKFSSDQIQLLHQALKGRPKEFVEFVQSKSRVGETI